MNEYRFHLQKYAAGKNTKQTCPQCGKKRCFVRYVDEEGEIGFPDYVGRCDHEDRGSKTKRTQLRRARR